MSKKMNYLLYVFLGTIIFGLLDLIFAIVIAGGFVGIHYEEVFFRSVIVALIGFMISLFFEFSEKYDKSTNELGRKAQRLTDSIKTSILGDLGKRINRFVDQNRTNIVGKLLDRWHKEIEIEVEPKSFRVANQAIALRSYEVFWDILVDEQKERTRNGTQPLNVFAIHVGSWKVWTKYKVGDKLLAKHRDFCKGGGKITRILCGSDEKPSPDIILTARKMKEAGVNVLYYNTSVLNFGFRWGFLYVKETTTSVIWKIEGQEAELEAICYQNSNEFNDKNLAESWDKIEGRVEEKYKDEAKWWLADESSTTV